MEVQHQRKIALQASREYLMNHIDGVMEMVQDTYMVHHEDKLDEKTLTSIEVLVKALAEELTQQVKGGPSEMLTPP